MFNRKNVNEMKNKLIAVTMALPPTILCAGFVTNNYHLAVIGFAGMVLMMLWGMYKTHKNMA